MSLFSVLNGDWNSGDNDFFYSKWPSIDRLSRCAISFNLPYLFIDLFVYFAAFYRDTAWPLSKHSHQPLVARDSKPSVPNFVFCAAGASVCLGVRSHLARGG